MSRLNCTFADFLDVILANGFVLRPDDHGGSHRTYRREHNGKVYLVTVAGTGKVEIKIGTLRAMIRQSGLDQKLFRR